MNEKFVTYAGYAVLGIIPLIIIIGLILKLINKI